MTEKFSLLELVEQGKIERTEYKPKIPTVIEGLNIDAMYVYRIPLDYLFFNEHNGRISSVISRLKKENKTVIPKREGVDSSYNDQIANLIEESNRSALKKTKQSIKEVGQQEFGYVLDDGCVIDGNRRFTALRQIAKETGETVYFEAVILPFSYDREIDKTKIKKLELNIQWGKESRRKYDDVDEAVDVFMTIEQEKLMTIEDYARAARKRKGTIKAKIDSVKLMQKFLEFINADTSAFYIVRDLKIYSLFEEAAKKFNKYYPYDGPSKEEAIDNFIGFIVYQIKLGTSTKAYVGRDYFKQIVSKSDKYDEFKESTEDAIDDLREKFEDSPVNSTADLMTNLENTEVKESVRVINENYNTQINKQDENIEKMIQRLDDHIKYLDDLVAGQGLNGSLSFDDLDSENFLKIKSKIDQINSLSKELKEIYDAE